MSPLCFVLMPFGRKRDFAGREIDFDAVYRDIYVPAITQAGLEPLRADSEVGSGIIHKPMFERLVLCDYALADLTTANANVFYELGVRHAAKRHTTVLAYADDGGQIAFDVRMLRALPYKLDGAGKPLDAAEAVAMFSRKLHEARTPSVDSPVYQLLDDYPDVQHEKTEVFRERVQYAQRLKNRLAQARESFDVAAMQTIQNGFGSGLNHQEAGVIIDLLLSYRAVNAWQQMVDLVEQLERPTSDTVLVREQYAFALNRIKRSHDAERVLIEVLRDHGPSSETYGLLGRVFKDRWFLEQISGNPTRAAGLIELAIDAYRKGFEADWRDAYPGVNMVTLMECREPADETRHVLLPVVRYAVERRVAKGGASYWDHATLLELAVVAMDECAARQHLARAIASSRESWERETTLANLQLLLMIRGRRRDLFDWECFVRDTLACN